MRHLENAGFTLLEVGLAITIGLIASSALVAFYYQVKDDAGDAQMRQRINSLKGVVETLYSAQGSCPSIADVRNAWVAKRPDDYNKSPWGGDVYTDAAMDPRTAALPNGSGIGPGEADLPSGTVVPWSNELNMTSGGLYYYRITDTINGTTLPSMIASASLWEQARKTQVTIIGYGLAGLKSSNRYYMVTSGR